MTTAYIFPGQGAQYVGMGVEIAEYYPQAKEIYDCASTVLGFDLLKMCRVGPTEILKQTENAQPAILVTSLACLVAAQPNLPPPVALAGLSLGEYTALVAANALDLKDAIFIVRYRGRFMQEATVKRDVAMAAILGLDAAQVESLCVLASVLGVCEVTNYNARDQFVVGGDVCAVARVIELAVAANASGAVPLAVSGAFHTSLMQPAAKRFAEVLATVPIRDTTETVITNVTAQPVCRAEEIRQFLLKQVTSPVHWALSVQNMVQDGVDTFIEFGPGRPLSSLIKRTFKEVRVLNVEDLTSMNKALESFNLQVIPK